MVLYKETKNNCIVLLTPHIVSNVEILKVNNFWALIPRIQMVSIYLLKMYILS